MIWTALLLLVGSSCLSAHPERTFTSTDRVTGQQVQCGFCPPGTFLRSRCSPAEQSQCAACPPGSYTAVWNYISRCLRCGVCGLNQLVKKECTASSDCQCECKPGFYHREDQDMCARHRECPPGHGVLAPGSPVKDTECFSCPAGSFSDVTSARANCTQHSGCSAPEQLLVLNGSRWHDSVCAERSQLKDGAEYLREIIPAFFAHHKMNIKRLRHVARRLQPAGGPRGVQQLGFSEVHRHIGSWAASATPAQIRQLPAVLTRAGAEGSGKKLQGKLEGIEARLKGYLSGAQPSSNAIQVDS